MAGAVVLAAVVIVPLAFSTRGDEPAESGSGGPGGSEDEIHPSELPLSAAQDDGEVRVVDSGFSPVTDHCEDGDADQMATWGLIVENTSRDTAATQVVELDYLDDAGRSVEDVEEDTADELKVVKRIEVIPPGGRAAVGDTVYLDRPGLDEVSIELGGTHWWPMDASGVEAAEITASEVETLVESGGDGDPEEPPTGESVDWEEDGPMVVQFRVASDYTRTLNNPGAYAIFRDTDGAITGGFDGGLSDIDAYPSGWSTQRFSVDLPLPDLDPGQTEVYPSTTSG